MASGLISLSTATALALARLVPEHDPRNGRTDEERNALAVALSGLIPIYKRDPVSGLSTRMSEEELRAGRFTNGATKFVFRDQRPEIHLLVVKEAEVDDAIASILASLIGRRYAEHPLPGTRQKP